MSNVAGSPTARRFARLRPGTTGLAPGVSAVPDAGMCLSAFVVIRPAAREGAVLMGRLRPDADWAAVGGLDPGRLARVGTRWMLPSSQLLLFEAPADAAARIVREQLETGPLDLAGPRVYSEAYRSTDPTMVDPHWDLHFVFEGRWSGRDPPSSSAFAELAFVEMATTGSDEIARDQGDVLALVGMPPLGREGRPRAVSGSARTRRP